MNVEKQIRDEIERREREIDSLRKALAALTGVVVKGESTKSAVKRRQKTQAEKAALSKKLKAAWKRRKAAAAKG